MKQLCQEPGKGEINMASLRSRKPGSLKPSGLGRAEGSQVREASGHQIK